MGKNYTNKLSFNMLKEDQFRFHARKGNKDLFFIDYVPMLNEEANMRVYEAKPSFPLHFQDFPNINSIIALLPTDATENELKKHASNAARLILKKRGAEKYFFPDSLLARSGTLDTKKYELFMKMTRTLYEDPYMVIKTGVPYTKYRNPKMFEVIRALTSGFIDKDSLKKISREDFESNLISDDLKNAYIDVFNKHAAFFLSVTDDEDARDESLMMFEGGKLVFAFVTKIEYKQKKRKIIAKI